MNDIDRLDWNLVPVLDALLRERNVSRAARRLGISQSAASGALSRLRRHFDDELLVRQGNSYELSPLAQRLAPLAAAAVESTRSVLTDRRRFDPATSVREFQVASTEYAQTLFGADLLRSIGREAPGVRATFRWPGERGADLTEWLGGIDGWFAPREALPGMPSTGEAVDRWVCVVDQHNAAVGDSLSIEEVPLHRWVIPTRPRDHDLPWRQRLYAHGIELPIAASTESFSAVPFLVAGSALVGVVQRGIAVPLAERCGLRILECPWSMLPLNITLWWHPNRQYDAAHRWFRDQVAAAMSGWPPE